MANREKLTYAYWTQQKVDHAVEYALDNGYNHIDAAWIYSKKAPSPHECAILVSVRRK
jgi:predicted aldo/keto reductase-like oxidoreductase